MAKEKTKVMPELEKEEPEKLEIEDILAETDEGTDLENAMSEESTAVDATPKTKVTEKVKTVTKEIKSKNEKPEKKAIFGEEKHADTMQPVENTIIVKKRSFWGTLAIITFTVLITAAVVLGGVWWMYQKNNQDTAKAETKVTEPITQKTENKVYVTAAEGLKLRKEPASASQQLAIIPYGTEIDVEETQGDWIRTTYQNQTGWVNSVFTTKTKPFDANWKVYSGSGFDSSAPKFSIKYPSDWSIDGYKIQKVDSGKTYKIAFGEGGHGLYEDENITTSQETVTYNGNTAKKTIIKSSGEITFISVQFQKSSTITTQIEFWVPTGYSSSYLDLFEKMLGTINFI